MQQYHTLSDEQLLTHLRTHEEAAFTELYNRYWEKLLATALYFTHDNQAAEDIVHEVFISLWTRKDELIIHSVSAYLATAVKFAVFKHIAREKRRIDSVKNYDLNVDDDTAEKLDAKFMEELLLQKTKSLPPKARLVFDYSRKQHLTVAEIAGIMDLTPKAVEYHMTKALRLLRHTFKKINLFFL